MNYISDVYINLNKIYYNTYEWSKKDKLIHIKKLPIFRIKTSDLKTIIKDEIIVVDSLINMIKNQIEISNQNKNMILCAFTDVRDTIVVQLSKNGKIIQKSSIHFTDNFNNFSTIKKLNLIDFKYTITKKLPINFLGKTETEKKKFLLKNIDELDDKKISYLYFECFNAKLNKISLIRQKLKNEIINNNEKICFNIDSFLKLIYAS